MQTKKKQARGNSPACSSSVPTHHAHFKHLVKCCLKFRFFMGFVTQPCNLHEFYVWKNPGRVSHTPWRAKKLPAQDIQIKTEFFISFGSEFLLFFKKEKEKLQLHFLFIVSVRWLKMLCRQISMVHSEHDMVHTIRLSSRSFLEGQKSVVLRNNFYLCHFLSILL